MKKLILLSAFATALSVLSAAENPYGVCAHVSRDEFGQRIQTYDMMKMAGLGYVRSDFDWWQCQREKNGAWNFDKFDKTVDDAAARGVKVLPILYGIPGWAQPAYEHLDEFREYIRQTTAHFGMKMPVVEIWNEQNISGFWKDPNPTNYLTVLKAAYETVKSVEPRVRVSFGGTAGVPMGFIEEVYKLGGAKYFDILSIHPYSHPSQPEGHMDAQIEKLRAIMAKYGDEKKPLWITELGWPTHKMNVGGFGLLPSALKVARPEKKSWNVVYAALCADDATPDPAIGEALLESLPVGSSVAVCTPKEVCRRLAAGGVDAVIYPFEEGYPVATVAAVAEFVKKGGTLVDFGGMPMWNAFRSVDGGAFMHDQKWPAWQDRQRLRIRESAWWMDEKDLPEEMPVFATAVASAAGLKQEPTGFRATRFLRGDLLKPGDRMIPLLEGKNPNNGKSAVAACVYAFDSDFKGRIIVSGLMGNGPVGTSTEPRQANVLARSLGIAFAEDIETYFWYEFRAPEGDTFYSESHFGIVHENFAPKPAYGAYMNFIIQRPVGSRQIAADWHDEKHLDYFPQWTRPDGKIAGMMWTLARPASRDLTFDGDNVRFFDVGGRRLIPRRTGARTWRVPLGDSPVYFVGARLVR